MSSTYKTKSGDLWDLIAYNELGNVIYTKDLMEANPEYLDIVIFSAGIELVIPDVNNSDTLTESSPPWEDES